MSEEYKQISIKEAVESLDDELLIRGLKREQDSDSVLEHYYLTELNNRIEKSDQLRLFIINGLVDSILLGIGKNPDQPAPKTYSPTGCLGWLLSKIGYKFQ